MTRRRAYELQGELRCFPPPLLFQMMALANITGRLSLSAAAGTCEVWFDRGRLAFARDGARATSLGDELVRRGLVLRADCEAAARERDRHPEGPRLGALLVARGKLRRADLQAVVRERVKEAIYTVVDWRVGRFTFEAGAVSEAEDVQLDLDLEPLLLECMARLDHARRDRADAEEGRG